jgi:hypothetical protein
MYLSFFSFFLPAGPACPPALKQTRESGREFRAQQQGKNTNPPKSLYPWEHRAASGSSCAAGQPRLLLKRKRLKFAVLGGKTCWKLLTDLAERSLWLDATPHACVDCALCAIPIGYWTACCVGLCQLKMSLAKLAEALPSMSQHRGGGGPPGRHVSRGGEGGHGQRDFFDGKRGGGEGAPGQEHPLQNEWAFWYMRRNGSRSQQESYEQAIRPLGSPFHSVEGFWAHYSHIKRPSSGPAGMANFTDVHMFRAGVKPM